MAGEVNVGESLRLQRLREKGSRVYGIHVYGNLIDCANVSLLGDEKGMRMLVEEAAVEGNMKVLDVKSWKIGVGVSVVAIILESHISVHTWPEYRYATVDVYSCGPHTDPRAAFNHIIRGLRPERVEIGAFERKLE